jgi:hypothetical protein
MWYQHAAHHFGSYAIHHPSPSLHHFEFSEVITLTVLVQSQSS